MKQVLASCAIALFISTGLHAAQATLATRIHYEGDLPSHHDQATVVISVYADKDSSEALWTEEQLVKVDAKGKFALDIGATLDEGIPASVFASGSGRWVGIAVKGELEQPRIMIVSVPYAVKARDAETVGGKTIAEIVRSDEFKKELANVLQKTAVDAQTAPAQQQAWRGNVFSGLTPPLKKQTNIAPLTAAGTFQYLPATGPGYGIYGSTNSTDFGTRFGGPAGVQGEVLPTAPGGYSAGVRGVNFGTGGYGIGVVGYQDGSGYGTYGYTPAGIGVYGETDTGTGVTASYLGAGAGTALQVNNGAIRATGTNKTAYRFIGVQDSASWGGLGLQSFIPIDSPLCNGDPNAIVTVTPLGHFDASFFYSPDDTHAIYVAYITQRAQWAIFHTDGTGIPSGAKYNVIIIKQ